MSDEEKLEQLKQEYMRLCHAMQSGVATLPDDPGMQPKHLRVGVNSAMVETGTIVQLLIGKGIFTEVEFFETVNKMMAQEVEAYKKRIEEKFGGKVKVNLY